MRNDAKRRLSTTCLAGGDSCSRVREAADLRKLGQATIGMDKEAADRLVPAIAGENLNTLVAFDPVLILEF